MQLVLIINQQHWFLPVGREIFLKSLLFLSNSLQPNEYEKKRKAVLVNVE